ncbi:hypothetical protein ACFL3C_04405 [Patescibacteria group bacterium]
MSDIDSLEASCLEYDTRILRLNPNDLQVNDYLNLETQGGSRYVFWIESKDEDGIFIKFYSGPNALEGSWGKLPDREIRVDEALDFEGGTTSVLIGIVVTHAQPFDYPFMELKYNEFLEELDSEQLKVGDHIYIGTEDGQTYVAEVMNVDEKMPTIRFIAGRNSLVGGEGNLKIKNMRVGMYFRNTFKSAMPVQNMVVLPYMDENMLGSLDEACEIKELDYDTELDFFYISQLEDGDFVYLETAGRNQSTYIIAFNHGVIEIIGGKNNFVGSRGLFVSGKISKGQKLKTSIAKTTLVKSIRVSKTYVPSEEDAVAALRDDLDAQQVAVMSHPSLMSQPVVWLGVPSGIHKLEIFGELDLEPNDLTAEALQRAWKRYQKENNPNSDRTLIPSEYNARLRLFRRLQEQYNDLMQKLGRINKILEED